MKVFHWWYSASRRSSLLLQLYEGLHYDEIFSFGRVLDICAIDKLFNGQIVNFAKDQKLRLFLLVHCLSPPWNGPQHQIPLFPKMIMPLNCHRWVRSIAATTSASTNPSATTSADHLSQRWQNHSGTLCLQTSSQKAGDKGWSFVLRASSPPHSRSPPPSTTTTRTRSSPGVHDNPPPRVQAGAQRVLYNRSGEYWHQDCWHPSFPLYGLTIPPL